MSLGREIERKYLVASMPAGLGGHPPLEIAQGYIAIADDGTEVRVRRADDETTLTVKRGRGLTRVEEAIELDRSEFERLWPLTEGCRIVKARHRIPLGGDLVAEVDVYGESLAGLVLAEVEFPSEEAARAFTPLPWMGAEVTEDDRYKNQSLAVGGAPRPDTS